MKEIVLKLMLYGIAQGLNSYDSSTTSRAASYFLNLGNLVKNGAGSLSTTFTSLGNKLFNKNNPAGFNSQVWDEFKATSAGLFSTEEAQDIAYVYALIMDKLGTWSVADDLGITR